MEDREQFSAYVVIPAKIFFDKDLPAGTKMLYGLISNMCNQRGYCWVKNDTLIRYLGGESDRNVRRNLAALRDRGYIRIEDNIGGAAVRKIFLADALPVYPDKNVRVLGQKCPGTRTKMSGCLNNDMNNKKNNTPQTPQGVSPELLEDFPEQLREAMTGWLLYKQERREQYRPMGLKSLITRTRKALDIYGEAAVVDTIERSMAAGYQGIAWDWAARYKPEAKEEEATDWW